MVNVPVRKNQRSPLQVIEHQSEVCLPVAEEFNVNARVNETSYVVTINSYLKLAVKKAIKGQELSNVRSEPSNGSLFHSNQKLM